MEDRLNNAINFTRIIGRSVISCGDKVVDATLGSGSDTLFLSSLVGECGHVFSFDIQKIAIEKSKEKLKECRNITFICDSHVNIPKYVPNGISFILFNLGYMHQGDKRVTTKADIVIEAVDKSKELLRKKGVILLVVYRGHDEGKREWDVLKNFISILPQNRYNAFYLDFPNQANNPPALIGIEKR